MNKLDRNRMMDKINAANWLIALVLLAVWAALVLQRCNSPEPVLLHDNYTAGKPDTVYVSGKPDTIKVPYPVYIEKTVQPKISTPDNSLYDSTFTLRSENGAEANGFWSVITWPKTDSIKLTLKADLTGLNILKTDTLLITRVDTLLRVYPADQPWYDTFWAGFSTALLTIALIITGVLAL